MKKRKKDYSKNSESGECVVSFPRKQKGREKNTLTTANKKKSKLITKKKKRFRFKYEKHSGGNRSHTSGLYVLQKGEHGSEVLLTYRNLF